jgi:hypothetical protein
LEKRKYRFIDFAGKMRRTKPISKLRSSSQEGRDGF